MGGAGESCTPVGSGDESVNALFQWCHSGDGLVGWRGVSDVHIRGLAVNLQNELVRPLAFIPADEKANKENT